MRRTGWWTLAVLAAVVLATSAAAQARRERPQRLENGLTLPAAPRIFLLESPRTFRFVRPDSLVRGVTSEDVESFATTEAEELQAAVVTILTSMGWTEVGATDSAEFDITVFLAARTEQVSETRTEQVTTATSNLPRCDASQGQRAGATCTNDPVRTRTYSVTRPRTARSVYHVIRRNDDGALKWWRHSTDDLDRVEALVARDLLRLLHSRG